MEPEPLPALQGVWLEGAASGVEHLERLPEHGAWLPLADYSPPQAAAQELVRVG